MTLTTQTEAELDSYSNLLRIYAHQVYRQELTAHQDCGRFMEKMAAMYDDLRTQLADTKNDLDVIGNLYVKQGEHLAEKEKELSAMRSDVVHGNAAIDGVHSMNEEIISLKKQLSTIREETIEPLRQIEAVCKDNASGKCDHRMALDFVHQITERALSQGEGR